MRLSRVVCRLLVLGVTASVVLAVGATQAWAVIVDAYPTWPIPADAPAGPPPIGALPTATNEAPPADQIADPVTPAAVCSGWYQQSNYGDRWPAPSTWWEYRCTYDYAEYHNTCPGPACNAFCPSCYWEVQGWEDYFYWNGSGTAFSGEFYSDSVLYDTGDEYLSTHWWDAPTARWYQVAPNAPPSVAFTFSCVDRNCTFDASGSFDTDGWIATYGWDFGEGTGRQTGSLAQASHSYSADGTYTVTLTATDDGGAAASVSHTISVATNTPPIASFTFTCSGLSCGFDGSRSADSDGAIVTYLWNFGDGTGGSGPTARHTYAVAGTYPATLTVTDDGGASASDSKPVTVTNLAPTARFTISCAALTCNLDGSGSADSDGTIQTYRWSFGDGAGGSGRTTVHDYPKAGNYTVTLTVTDNDGGIAVSSQRINPISLSARGYKAGGQKKVDLSWNGASGTSFDLYRSGLKIGTVQTTAYTDTINMKGSASYTYKVCEAESTTCSNDATVSF